MRRVNLLFMFLFICTLCIGQSVNPYFYYYQGEKQILELDTDHVYALDKKIQNASGSESFQKISLKDISARDYTAKKNFLKSAGTIDQIIPCFITATGDTIGFQTIFM